MLDAQFASFFPQEDSSDLPQTGETQSPSISPLAIHLATLHKVGINTQTSKAVDSDEIPAHHTHKTLHLLIQHRSGPFRYN